MYSIVEIYIFVLAEIVYARYTILIHKLGNIGIVAGAIECGQFFIELRHLHFGDFQDAAALRHHQAVGK